MTLIGHAGLAIEPPTRWSCRRQNLAPQDLPWRPRFASDLTLATPTSLTIRKHPSGGPDSDETLLATGRNSCSLQKLPSYFLGIGRIGQVGWPAEGSDRRALVSFGLEVQAIRDRWMKRLFFTVSKTTHMSVFTLLVADRILRPFTTQSIRAIRRCDMKRFTALALVLGLVLVVAGCPAAPESKDSGSTLDPTPPPADVPQDAEKPAAEKDAAAPEKTDQELPPLPKTSDKADTPAPKLVPAAPAEKPAAKPAEKSAAKPAEKPADKPAEKPAAKPAEKPADKPAEKPADKPAEKPAAKPAEKPADKPAEKPADKPAEKPAAKPAEKPADKPAEKPADKPAEKPADKPAEKKPAE